MEHLALFPARFAKENAADKLKYKGSLANKCLKHADVATRELSNIRACSVGLRLQPHMQINALQLILLYLTTPATAAKAIAMDRDFGTFLLDLLLAPPIHWLSPGFQNPSISTHTAIEALKLQLAHKARIDVFHSKDLIFRTGLLYTPTTKRKTS